MKVIQSASLMNDMVKINISLDILTKTKYKIALYSWGIQLTLEKLRKITKNYQNNLVKRAQDTEVLEEAKAYYSQILNAELETVVVLGMGHSFISVRGESQNSLQVSGRGVLAGCVPAFALAAAVG